MKKAKVKDILIRAGKTFLQAFISAFTVESFVGVTDCGTLKRIALGAIMASIAAGISAVWNTFAAWMADKIGKDEA